MAVAPVCDSGPRGELLGGVHCVWKEARAGGEGGRKGKLGWGRAGRELEKHGSIEASRGALGDRHVLATEKQSLSVQPTLRLRDLTSFLRRMLVGIGLPTPVPMFVPSV